MIKKFKEYLESNWTELPAQLSKEEVEDQFLRLKEILNCNVDITGLDELLKIPGMQEFKNGKYIMKPLIYSIRVVFDLNLISESNEEIDNIINRLENTYPVKIKIINLRPDYKKIEIFKIE